MYMCYSSIDFALVSTIVYKIVGTVLTV